MMQWINIEQVTIEKIHEKGGLWVVEALPSKGKLKVNLYETDADTEDFLRRSPEHGVIQLRK